MHRLLRRATRRAFASSLSLHSIMFLLLVTLFGAAASAQAPAITVNPAVTPGATINVGAFSFGSFSSNSLAFQFSQSLTLTSVSYDPGLGGVAELAVQSLRGAGCYYGHALPAGTECSVETAIAGLYPGHRSGTLRITTSSGVYLIPVSFNVYGSQAALTPGVLASPVAIAGQPMAQTGGALALDAAGNLYLTENNVINKIDASTGAVTVYAGTPGNPNRSGDGGPATSADIQYPVSLSVSPAGDLYILSLFEFANDSIRKVDLSTGIITTVAGEPSGRTLGKGGSPLGPGADGAAVADENGNLYVAIPFLNEIEVVTNGVPTPLINNNVLGVTCGIGPLYTPTVMTVGGGHLYFYSNNQIFKISTDTTKCQSATPVAGTGVAGSSGDGTAAVDAQIGAVSGLALDAAGDLYLADSSNNTVRVVNASNGKISTIAGAGSALPSVTVFSGLSSLALDTRGNLYILGAVGIVQKIDVSHSSLAFRSTQVGSTSTDSPHFVLTTNIGNTTLAAAASSSISPGFTVDSASTCIASGGATPALAPAATCTTSVDFAPILAGNITGQLSPINSTLDTTVSLSGIATAPASTTSVRISPAKIDFGTVMQGNVSGAWTINLANTGNKPLQIVGSVLSDATNFQLSGNCKLIAAYNSCNLTLVFKPQSAGVHLGSITLTDSASAGSGTQIISLTGYATSNAPVIAVSSANINFGKLVVGASSPPWVVYVANKGASPLLISNIVLSDPENYTSTSFCGASVPAYSGCSISLVFSPQGVSSYASQLRLTTNASSTETVVNLTGVGVAPPPPVVKLAPAAINFGTIPLGSASPTWTLYIGNTGGSALNIAGILLSDTSNFILGGSCATIPAYSSCNETVVFKPQTAGVLNATITLTDNAASHTQTLALTGKATQPH